MKALAICGSMRFNDHMFDEQVRLSKEGVIGLMSIITPIAKKRNRIG